MTEIIVSFVLGFGIGLASAFPLRDWALSKLKGDEPQPVMGGPIQPDKEEKTKRK